MGEGQIQSERPRAVQMLQDIFLKADSMELQGEVLNRMFKIFSHDRKNVAR